MGNQNSHLDFNPSQQRFHHNQNQNRDPIMCCMSCNNVDLDNQIESHRINMKISIKQLSKNQNLDQHLLSRNNLKKRIFDSPLLSTNNMISDETIQRKEAYMVQNNQLHDLKPLSSKRAFLHQRDPDINEQEKFLSKQEFIEDFSNVRILFNHNQFETSQDQQQTQFHVFDSTAQTNSSINGQERSKDSDQSNLEQKVSLIRIDENHNNTNNKKSRQSKLEQSYKRGIQKPYTTNFNKENQSPTNSQTLSNIKQTLFKGQNQKRLQSDNMSSFSQIVTGNINLQSTTISSQPSMACNTTKNAQTGKENIKIDLNSKVLQTQNQLKVKKVNGRTKSLANLQSQYYHQQFDMPLSQNKQIIMEGSLLKYKPGMSSQYRMKYLVLRQDKLTIFKSRWQANLPHQESNINTVFSLPISVIGSCQRVKVDVRKNKIINIRQSLGELNNQASQDLFQFEIYLKDEFQDKISHLEIAHMQRKPLQQLNINLDTNSNNQESSQMRSPKNFDQSKQSSVYQESHASSKHPSIIGLNNFASALAIQSGGKHSRVNSGLSAFQHNPYKVSNHNKQRSSVISSTNFDDLRVSLSLQNPQYEEILSQTLQQPLIMHQILNKNPSSWIQGLSNQQTWTHREIEWYSGQKRFLFATESEEECNQWVLAINMITRQFLNENSEKLNKI
eukprot:403332564